MLTCIKCILPINKIVSPNEWPNNEKNTPYKI